MNGNFKNIISVIDNIELQVLIILRMEEINKILEYRSTLSSNLRLTYENELKYMKELLHKLEQLYIEG